LLHMSKKKSGELTTARELADKFVISQELMGKLLQSLAQNKFIISVQGVKGGYFLAKSPERISTQSVIQAIEGSIHFADCLGPTGCKVKEREKVCEIKGPIKTMQTEMTNFLKNYTIKDLQARMN